VRPPHDLVRANGPYFIKIDTQGFEREMLAGGPKALAGATGVLLELPVINIYDDVWTLHEAVGSMREIGFIPSQFEPVGHHNPIRWRRSSSIVCSGREPPASANLAAQS
jgi:hypothetical protein